MLNKILLDTSVFIPFLRHGLFLEEILALTRGEVLYFSSIVAQELYAGSMDRRFRWHMDKLYFRFQKAGRLIVPNHTDWRLAGLALSRLAERHRIDRVRRASLVNDSLIAACCRREGVSLVTLNEKDFHLLREVIDFQYRIPQKA